MIWDKWDSIVYRFILLFISSFNIKFVYVRPIVYILNSFCLEILHFSSLLLQQKPLKQKLQGLVLAEGKGFEPLWAGAQTVFKTASL